MEVYFLTFRAIIKLLIKALIAKSEVIIITNTLTIPGILALTIAPVNGLIRPKRIRNVNTTAICADTLLPFLKPGVIIKRIVPVNTGISAVNEGVSDVKYAQVPRVISTSELRKFIK